MAYALLIFAALSPAWSAQPTASGAASHEGAAMPVPGVEVSAGLNPIGAASMPDASPSLAAPLQAPGLGAETSPSAPAIFEAPAVMLDPGVAQEALSEAQTEAAERGPSAVANLKNLVDPGERKSASVAERRADIAFDKRISRSDLSESAVPDAESSSLLKSELKPNSDFSARIETGVPSPRTPDPSPPRGGRRWLLAAAPLALVGGYWAIKASAGAVFMGTAVWAWLAFGALFMGLLVLDLSVVNRGTRDMSVRRALVSTAAWTGIALAFNLALGLAKGLGPALEFLSGYVVEQSLSIDNLFVFISIFSFFKVPSRYQHKVLYWGIIGAAGFRLAFILAGAALIGAFHWVTYGLGGLLLFTAVKMLLNDEDAEKPLDRHPIVRFIRRLLPVSKDFDGERFWTKISGKTMATPLLLVLLLLEATDILFSVDSIPAVLSVTSSPFIALTSNLFAILGLRSLYFAVAVLMNRFHRLGTGLAAILGFVGLKMLAAGVFPMGAGVSIGVIGLLLGASMAASLLWPKRS